MSSPEVGEVTEEDWSTLLHRIEDGKCTPFLGAGVNAGLLPLGSEVSRAWARESGYPLGNIDALDQVAQYIAVQRDDNVYPKEAFIKTLRADLADIDKTKLDSFLNSPEQPLGVLANLPLPVYITTNYDDLLVRALTARKKSPRRELCRWNERVRKHKSVFDATEGFVPDPTNPIVFHLHGHDEVPESMVLTEDDYIDFLVNISLSRTSKSKQRVLPERIQEALTGSSLLFVGYRLADINFRVIFRGLVDSLEQSSRRVNVSVQLPPNVPGQDPEQIKKYLRKYFDGYRVRIFWGGADEFVRQLGERWARSRRVAGTA